MKGKQISAYATKTRLSYFFFKINQRKWRWAGLLVSQEELKNHDDLAIRRHKCLQNSKLEKEKRKLVYCGKKAVEVTADSKLASS